MLRFTLVVLGLVLATAAYAQTAANLADQLNALPKDKVGKTLDDPSLIASISDFLQAKNEPCATPEKVQYANDAIGMNVHRVVKLTCGGQPVTLKIIPGSDNVELFSSANSNINWQTRQMAREEWEKLPESEKKRYRQMERADELRKEKYKREDEVRHSGRQDRKDERKHELEVEKLRQQRTYTIYKHNYNN